MHIDIGPVLSALSRSRTGAILVALQVAIALAIVVNAAYIAKQRLDLTLRPTGIDVDNIFVLSSTGFTSRYKYLPSLHEDLDFLRGIPGVIAATAMNSLPLTLHGSGISMTPRPDDRQPGVFGSYFDIDEQGLASLGVRLAAGRNFRREEVGPPQGNGMGISPQLIISQDLAQVLFPHGNALGQNLYFSGRTSPGRIVGITEHMQGTWLMSRAATFVMMGARPPNVPEGANCYYVVRTQAGQRDRIMRIAQEHLATSNPDRVIEWAQPLDRFRQRSYATASGVAGFLAGVTVLLFAITALGAFGLATFNVATRTKQIGTRRALGARRRDVMAYFMVENWLVTTTGVVVGCALALGVGYWLSYENHLPRLDLYYLLGGVLVLFAIGQLAAWQPARKAARVSPAVATRTV